jgi:hypothetical protein
MSETPICPQCHQPLIQVGDFWICPKHGQLSIDKPHAPLRIFLSYGHDANEELVRRIKNDLEKRGHDVWFDKNEIKFGDDWRREITDGITGSNRVLSFLSKHSTRDPGVCLDEIAIAIGVKGGNIQTILVESETEVKPPASISHIQWLDMHDWKERKESGSISPPEQSNLWETWYQTKLDEIIRVVESDESRRFAGEIETLSGHLKPIASDSRISTLLRKGFIGRKWLSDAIEQWRTGSDLCPPPSDLRPTPSRLFWITGDPGVGKSAFAAHLTHFGRDKVIAAQFVEWDKPDHRDARRVVRSLAFQLATRLPDYRKLLLTLPEIAELDRKDAAELFDYLLANPLKTVIGGGRERLLIVIDALDEAGEAGRNPLVDMLARHAPRLPDWLGLVVTSRPESAVQTPLQGLNPFVLDTRTEANRADLCDYLRYQLASQLQQRPDADRLIGQILAKSEGVFLYAERFCDDVQHGHLSLDRPGQFPQGLGGIFCQWFQRQFPDLENFRKDIRPALRAILAAREPLPVEILQRLFNWQDEELRDFTRTLGSLFPVTKEVNGQVVKPYHKALADWLADEAKADKYYVSLNEGHVLLATTGLSPSLQFTSIAAAYYRRYLAYHVAASRRWDRLLELLADRELDLLQQWIEQGESEVGRFCLSSYLYHLKEIGKSTPDQYALATQLARIELRRGNLSDARDLLVEALAGLSASNNPLLLSIAAHEYGSVCLETGDCRQARRWYRKALKAARSQVPISQSEIASNLVALAASYHVQQQFSRRVEKLAASALCITRQSCDGTHEIEALRILADICKDAMRYTEAENYLSCGLDKAHQLVLPYAEMALLATQGWMRYQMATLHRLTVSEAITSFEQLATLARKYSHIRYMGDAWSGLGQCALVAHESQQISQAIQQMLQIERLCDIDHIRVRRKLLEACAQHQKRDFAMAAKMYQSALADASSAQLLQRQADAHVGYGAILWHQNKKKTAHRQWAEAIVIARKCTPIRKKLVAASIRASRADATATPL